MSDIPRFTCSILRSTPELEVFCPTWQDLWASDREATPFQHPAWLLPWWRAFGDGHVDRELRCIVVHDTSAQKLPVAFLPAYVYPDLTTGERQLLLLGAGTSDYLDGVFTAHEAEDRQAQAHAALYHLLSLTGWDVLHMAQLRARSALLSALQALPAKLTTDSALDLTYAVETWPAEPTSRLPASPLSGLPVKIRRNALYYRNRAQREGELTLHIATEADCLYLFEELVSLHNERWQAAGQSGVLSDPAVLAHHRLAVPALARAGLLRFIALRLGTKTLGVLYSLIDARETAAERTQYFYLPAFSLAHADLRPGTLLNALAMEHAAQEGVRTIDLLRGDEPYKQLWHAETFATFGITLRRVVSSGPSEAGSR